MKLIEIQGDIFNYRNVAHGVNCQGVMGAGVAVGFRDRCPEMYQEYREFCRMGLLEPGKMLPWQRASGGWVFNLATQDKPGRYARVEWIRQSVTAMLDYAKYADIRNLHSVRLGCGIGGLQWPTVRTALESINSPQTLTIVSQ